MDEQFAVSDRIWNEEPIYRIKFSTSQSYEQFAKRLQERWKNIDVEGKIRLDPGGMRIDVHYYPRIARSVLMPLALYFRMRPYLTRTYSALAFEFTSQPQDDRFADSLFHDIGRRQKA